MSAAPRFGDPVENLMASTSNPTRIGHFVRVVDRRGRRMNPGLFWEITDGKGEFWLTSPANCRVLTVSVRTVARWESMCTECPWTQIHVDPTMASTAAKQHRAETHPGPGRILTDDERDSVRAWIEGIEMGVWEPTSGAKRLVGEMLQRLLHADERGRA